MAEILKFVYIVILFVSLLLIVVASESKLILIFYLMHNHSIIFSNISLFLFFIIGECVTDDDCEKLYPTNEYRMMCYNGYCMNLLNGKIIYLLCLKKIFPYYNIGALIIFLKLSYISPIVKFFEYH